MRLSESAWQSVSLKPVSGGAAYVPYQAADICHARVGGLCPRQVIDADISNHSTDN